jgi:predicted phosphodiesterase
MTSRLRLAFLGDIHGNLPALEAALADVEGQSPDTVYLLGDLVNRCPWNNEVMALLADREWPSVQGNHDLVVGDLNTAACREPFKRRDHFPLIYWTWEGLRPAYHEKLRTLPPDLVVELDSAPPIHLFHGVPGDSFVGVYPETSEAEIAEMFAPFDEPLIVCAHTHRPLDRTAGGKRVINGGSVGLPYNSDPRAQYLILNLEQTADGPAWQPDFRQVDYDRSHVPAAFQRSGMLDHAGPLAELYMRTVLTGEPWASDFGHWMKSQTPEVHEDLRAAVDLYLRHHGPHNWAFFQ